MFSIGVFAIIRNENGQMLLSHRKDMDIWNLAGGGVEDGESPQTAIKREIKEETGLTVSIKRLVALNPKPQKNELVLTFECEIEGGKLTETDEADRHGWFPPDNLPTNIPPKHLERIRHFIEKPDELYMEEQNQPSTKELLSEGGLEKYNKDRLR